MPLTMQPDMSRATTPQRPACLVRGKAKIGLPACRGLFVAIAVVVLQILFAADAAEPPGRAVRSQGKPRVTVAPRSVTGPQTSARPWHQIVPASASEPADEAPDIKPDPPKVPTSVDIADELAGLARESVVPATGEEYLIDLSNALRLAEAANPEIALGRQAICEALALQLEARGMLLPSLNAGTMYHLHQGRLQTSFGQIRSVNLQSVYVGGGTGAMAANTVAIPAVRIFAQLGEAFYAPLAAGQVVSSRSFASRAIDNSVLLEVVSRYLELVAAESRLEAIHRSEDDLRQVVVATGAFAKAGQGRVGDFNRARTAALLLHAQEQQAQEEAVVAAAELSRVLHLDPALRLKTRPGPIEVVQLVDPAYSMAQLIAIAQMARPEMSSRMADIAAADYRLQQECVRPWVPTLSVGFSGGAFGGGSNLVQSFFQHLGGRTDFDVMAYWTLENMGAGNAALQKQRRAERDRAIAARGLMYNQIGREVSDAYLSTAARREQFELARQRLETSARGAREEIRRTRGGEGLPLETINSVDLLIEAREAIIRTLVDYNRAQIELFVAVGQTPHVTIADPRGVSGDMFPATSAEMP